MFCRNCGKDIGDSKFCPECGTKQDDINEVKAEPVTETPKQDAKNGEAPVYQNPYEPNMDTPNFQETLKKDCKGYKALDIIGTVRSILVLAVPVTFVLLFWLLNRGEKFGYILFAGILNSLEIEAFLILIEVPVSVAMLIVFIVQMKKKNVSNKELFKSVYADGEFSYGAPGAPDFSPWEAISFKYQKTSFVIAIVQRVIYFIQTLLTVFIFAITLGSRADTAKTATLFTNEFNILNSLSGILTLLIVSIVIDIVISIVMGILNAVRKSSHKKLVEKLRAGELDK